MPPCNLCRHCILTMFLLWSSLSVYSFTVTTTSNSRAPSFIATKISNTYGRPSNLVLEAAAKKNSKEKKANVSITDADAKKNKKQKIVMTDSVNGVIIDTKKKTNGKANSSPATPTNSTSTDNATASVDVEEEKEEIVDDEQTILDKEMMRKAIQMAQSSGGERGSHSPFPKPIAGAVLATSNGKVLSTGRTSYEEDAVEAVIRNAGIEATPLSEWCVSWSSDPSLRSDIRNSTLYITLEPSAERKGMSFPPITQLIQMVGIRRIVIGCADPVDERSSKGASALHSSGLEVKMGIEREECENLVEGYSKLVNTKLQKMARKHLQSTGRPLGFLHCSVIDSDDVTAFANNGNAFAKNFGGQSLSFRDFGSYELAPPPDSIWAKGEIGDINDDDTFTEVDDFFDLEFEDEDEQESLGSNPMMPWYEQIDAVVATLPREGNGPVNDQSLMARLNGLKWLATSGNMLPANVERILVMDASSLSDLPLTNADPNLPAGVDVEAFWKAKGRKPTRVLLRSGDNAQAIAAATSAAKAAEQAAEAAQTARTAIECGEAELAAEAAIKCQQAALAATTLLQKEMQISQDLKQKLTSMGAQVEVMRGKEPIDVMNHLGKRNGYNSVVWRAGCWGQRGVETIVAGAFQWISAHLAVDAAGGKFWQLMLAERAIQGACGSESRVKVLAEQEDISLEYCDEEDADCELTVNGKPIRHIRLDCRVLVEDPERKHEYIITKTAPVEKKLAETAPWFI